MTSCNSKILDVPQHDLKQIPQAIPSFRVAALHPKCTAFEFTYMTPPFFPCLASQNRQVFVDNSIKRIYRHYTDIP